MSLKNNLIANYFGAVWSSVVGIIFLPIYLRFIGIEGYGLVGIFTMLSASLSILDIGFSALTTREAASYSRANPVRKIEILTLLKTIELIFLITGISIAIIIFFMGPLIVKYWLNVSSTFAVEAELGIRWMGIVIAIQFVVSYYNGCLNGLQKQVSLNLINVVGSTFRSGGAALALWLISPGVDIFFAWQAISFLCTLIFLRNLVKNSLLITHSKVSISFRAVIRARHFLGGIGMINLLGLLLTQLDKLILSKTLTLVNFGYYSLAWMLGTLVFRASGPVFNAYYPKMAELFELKNINLMLSSYLQGAKIMSIATVPFSLWIAFFSQDILFLWTKDFQLSNVSYGALSIISIGTMLNSFMQLPYGMQLAHGMTRLTLIQNILSILLILPLTWYLATHYGLTAIAIPWLLVNLGYLVFSVPAMYRILDLPGMLDWYVRVIIKPIIFSGLAIYFTKLLFIEIIGNNYKYYLLFITLSNAILAAIISVNFIKLNNIKLWKSTQ